MKKMSVEVKASTNVSAWLLEDRIVNIKSFESQQPTNHLKEIGHVSNPRQKIPSAVFSCDSPLG